MISNSGVTLEVYLQRMLPVLNRDIKDDAIKAGWPRNLANSLRVVLDKQVFDVQYPEQFSKEIENLEYGTPFMPPNPVMRTFLTRHDAAINSMLTEWTAEALDSVVGSI